MRFAIPLAALVLFSAACGASHDSDPPSAASMKQLDSNCNHDTRTSLALPGPAYYPEGVDIGPDGTFYAGSMGTGAIVRVPPGAAVAEPFVPPQDQRIVLGVLVDPARRTLWACIYDQTRTPPAQQPSSVHGYDLATGALTASYEMPGHDDSFCNDLILDERGNLYATDSAVSTIVRLAPGASKLETWAESPLFQPGPELNTTLNGIVFDRRRHRLIVTKSDSGQLLSVPIRFDGSPGDVSIIALDAPLDFPDGVEQIDDDTLLVMEHKGGTVAWIDLDPRGKRGKKTVIATDLQEPTTAVVHHGSAWVSVSQERYFDGKPGSPTLPFRVQRFILPGTPRDRRTGLVGGR